MRLRQGAAVERRLWLVAVSLRGTWRWAPCVQGRGIRLTAWSPVALSQDERESGQPSEAPAPWSGCLGCLGLSWLQAAAPQWAAVWMLGTGGCGLRWNPPSPLRCFCWWCVGAVWACFSPLLDDSFSLHQNSLIPVDSWQTHLVQGSKGCSLSPCPCLCPGVT